MAGLKSLNFVSWLDSNFGGHFWNLALKGATLLKNNLNKIFLLLRWTQLLIFTKELVFFIVLEGSII